MADHPSSSPERTKTRTYAGKAKRKRDSVANTERDASESEEEQHVKEGESMPPPASPPAKPRTVKPAQSAEPMSDTSPVKKPQSKALNRVSIASLSDLKGPAGKPVSKAALVGRFQTPDVDDDGASVAESSKTMNRKTEEDRIQFFHDQPLCSEVEPHRAFCKGCDQWVPLNPKRRYVMRLWTMHRKQCKGINSPSAKPASKKSPQKAREDESEDEDDNGSVMQSTSDQSARKSEAERQVYFEADPRAEEVRPYEVLCKTCQKWIKLDATRRFSLKNWKAHQNRCSGSIPSSRVATAERKLKLVNDASAKHFTTKTVVCTHCKETVALEGEGDYDLTNWDEHKASCTSAPRNEPVSATLEAQPENVNVSSPEQSPRRFEKSADRPPPSVASTEATAVAPESARQGTKRAREEDEETVEEQPPRARQRTESNQPSGALGWLLLPFKSFVNGFKEGMSSSPSGTTSKPSST